MSSIGRPTTNRVTNLPTDLPTADASAAAAALGNSAFAGNAKLEQIAEGNGSLARGNTGAAVKLVQAALVDLGVLGAQPGADGSFGPKTQAAVMAFQKSANLRQTGVIDQATMVALDHRTAAPAPTPAPPPTPTPGPIVPPSIPGGTIVGKEEVVEGANAYSLDDDVLYMLGGGEWKSSINRDIYTAGYLARDTGPLNKPLGTPETPSKVLSDADNTLNTTKSPVERFDEAMKRATGASGKLTAKYAVEGKQPEAASWWGYCDRWAYNALDPTIAGKVDKPILLNGVYFSTAELRGLASFMGRADEGSKALFKKDVSPLDLEKSATMFLKTNGSGFVSSIWNNSKHAGDYQVWNQPFDSVDHKNKPLTGDEAAKVLKEQFNLTGDAAKGKTVYAVETVGRYGSEMGDDYEGEASHSSKTWKSFILADSASGKALDGKWAPDSDDPPEYIWRPDRTGNYGPEGNFFRKLISEGVPQEKVTGFEAALAALPPNKPVDAATKAKLLSAWRGLAGAYPAADLTKKLAPYGLKPADFQ